MTPAEVAARFEAKAAGPGQWQARCPAHDDRRASLSIGTGRDGRPLVRCFAGCETQAILAAVGLRLSDLFNDDGKPPRRSTAAVRPGSAKLKTFPTADEAQAYLERQRGPVAARWAYTDGRGEPCGYILRWDDTNGKTIRPVSLQDDGRWALAGLPTPRALYRLPDLSEARTVYVVEGEKCADAIRELGLTATTSPHGAQSASKADWTPLTGRDVYLLPDNDEAGEQYGRDVTRRLLNLDPPATVRVVRLPDLPPGGDVVDHIEARRAAGLDNAAIRAELLSLADAAEPVAAEPASDKHTTKPRRYEPVIVRMSDIQAQSVSWLWPNRVALGRLTAIAGAPGEGKSFFTLHMAATVSVGGPWPDGNGHAPAGDVIIVNGEDDAADTIRPRLDAMYADVERVHVLKAVRHVDREGDPHETCFTLADIDILETAIERLNDCRLAVIDPVGSFLGGGVDMHRDNETRAVLAPLAMLAEKYNVAAVIVAHHRKAAAARADDLLLGSKSFSGICRAVHHVVRDPMDKTRRYFLPGKNNIGPESGGMAFSIGGEPARVRFEKGIVAMSADDLLAADVRGPGRPAEARESAADFLREVLGRGPVAVGEAKSPAAGTLRAEAKEAGLTWRTVRRAADELKIKRIKSGFGGHWTWALPVSAEGGHHTTDTEGGQNCQTILDTLEGSAKGGQNLRTNFGHLCKDGHISGVVGPENPLPTTTETTEGGQNSISYAHARDAEG